MSRLTISSAALALVLLVSAAGAVPPEQSGQFDEIEDEDTQMKLFEDDSTETKYLKEDKQFFADFCLQARDESKLFLQNKASTGSKYVFSILFGSDDEIYKDFGPTDDVRAVSDGTMIIEAGLKEGDLPNVEESPEEKIEAVKRVSVFSAIGEAVQTVLNTAFNFVASRAAQRLQLLKSKFTGPQIMQFLQEACVSLNSELKDQLISLLAETKTELLADPAAAPYLSVIANTRLENVGCVTTSRIKYVTMICNILPAIAPFFR